MFTLINNTVKMYRGDTIRFDQLLITNDGEVYELKDGDKLVFYLRKTPSKWPLEVNEYNSNIVIQKEYNGRHLELYSSDTKFLQSGKYYYDTEFISGESTDEHEIKETVSSGEFYIMY